MRKNKIQPLAIRSLALFVFIAALMSFTPRPGGDTFEILLNEKVMIREMVYGKRDLKTVALPESDDLLRIHYNHCGKVGTARSIALKGQKNKILKEWNFTNVESGATPHMALKAKEVTAYLKAGAGSATLVYTSKEIPEGVVLAEVSLSNGERASLK